MAKKTARKNPKGGKRAQNASSNANASRGQGVRKARARPGRGATAETSARNHARHLRGNRTSPLQGQGQGDPEEIIRRANRDRRNAITRQRAEQPRAATAPTAGNSATPDNPVGGDEEEDNGNRAARAPSEEQGEVVSVPIPDPFDLPRAEDSNSLDTAKNASQAPPGDQPQPSADGQQRENSTDNQIGEGERGGQQQFNEATHDASPNETQTDPRTDGEPVQTTSTTEKPTTETTLPPESDQQQQEARKVDKGKGRADDKKDAVGANKSPEGSKDAAGKRKDGGEGSSSGSKRSTPDSGHDETGGPTQRPRGDANERAGEELSDDPCVRFRELLDRDQGRAGSPPRGFVGPLPNGYGRYMNYDDLFRIIAAVTEAMPETPFALIDHTAWNMVEHDDMSAVQNVVRPGHDALIPLATTHMMLQAQDEAEDEVENAKVGKLKGTVGSEKEKAAREDGRGHLSLLALQRDDTRSAGGAEVYNYTHYESWRGGERHAQYLQAPRWPGDVGYVHDTSRRLLALNWATNTDMINPSARLDTNAFQQRNKWACGIFTVLNAWAIALGMQLRVPPSQRLRGEWRHNQFTRHSITLLTLALQGHLSSTTIENFFRCYEFTNKDSRVLNGRHFAHTVGFPNLEAYSNYVGRLRLEAAFQPCLPRGTTLDVALDMVRTRFPDRNYNNLGNLEENDLYMDFVAATANQSHSPGVGSSSQAHTQSANNKYDRETTPGDISEEAQETFQRDRQSRQDAAYAQSLAGEEGDFEQHQAIYNSFQQTPAQASVGNSAHATNQTDQEVQSANQENNSASATTDLGAPPLRPPIHGLIPEDEWPEYEEVDLDSDPAAATQEQSDEDDDDITRHSSLFGDDDDEQQPGGNQQQLEDNREPDEEDQQQANGNHHEQQTGDISQHPTDDVDGVENEDVNSPLNDSNMEYNGEAGAISVEQQQQGEDNRFAYEEDEVDYS